MNIQTKIKELRDRKGLSQEELCENSGISLRTIQRIENGECVPRGSTLKIIASSLNVSPDFLINIPIEKNDAIDPSLNKPKRRGIRFPWYVIGFTIIGLSSGFLMGTIMMLSKVIPTSSIGGSIMVSGSILLGAIGIVVGNCIERKNR